MREPTGLEQPDRPEPPDWSTVPEPQGHPAFVSAAYALAGLAIAVLLWLRSHHVPAVVLATLVVLGGVLAVASPRVAALADRARGAIQHAAGRVLALVLLSVVQALVFFPASLVLRLLRRDPLAVPAGDDVSFWRPTAPPGGRPLPRRQFTYEPGRAMGGARRPARVRAAIGLAAVLVVLDLGAGAVLHRLDGSGRPASAGGQQSLLFFPHIAASHGQPFLPALAAAIDNVWYAKHYDSFLGWEMPATFRSRWLNITDGVRRSYVPTRGSGRPLTVDFFGGSTMFGLFERDAHTIPSEVARFAERDGIRLRPVNLGRMAYNNYQETLLLSERTAMGDRPDLAVFYDGNNELVGQFRLGPHLLPAHQEAQEYARRIGFGVNGEAPPVAAQGSRPGRLFRAYKDLSGTFWFARKLLGRPTEGRSVAQPLTSAWIADQRGHARAAGRGAAAVYGTGVRLGRTLGRGDGFPTAFFWQPIIYSKPIRPGERQAVGALGTDPRAWAEAYRVARAHLPAGVLDISGALDTERAPVMYDFVHTNETGARVIARALYAHLRPMLLRLRAEAARR